MWASCPGVAEAGVSVANPGCCLISWFIVGFDRGPHIQPPGMKSRYTWLCSLRSVIQVSYATSLPRVRVEHMFSKHHMLQTSVAHSINGRCHACKFKRASTLAMQPRRLRLASGFGTGTPVWLEFASSCSYQPLVIDMLVSASFPNMSLMSFKLILSSLTGRSGTGFLIAVQALLHASRVEGISKFDCVEQGGIKS